MSLMEKLLEGAPPAERLFEVRVYDLCGRMVDALLMHRQEDGRAYVSERYDGPDTRAAITLFRDGVGVQVIAYGLPMGPGFFVKSTIPDPDMT